MQKKLFLGAVILLALIAGGAGYYYSSTRMPDLDRPFTPAERFPEDIRQQSIERVNAATAELRKNPDLISRWLEIAVYRKGADDFKGAEEIWKYLTRKWPEDATAYGNLADLYQSVLDKPKSAEQYWKKYLEVVPKDYNIAAYRSLHDLYRTKLDSPEKAREILGRGIEEHPEETGLIVALAVFERDQENTEEARALFLRARDIAIRVGNTALSDILAEELQKLGE